MENKPLLSRIEYELSRFGVPQSLDGNKTYAVRELGLSASDTALMQIGLPLSVMGDYDAWQWHIEEVQ